MEHTIQSLEQEHHVGGGTKEVIKVTVILTVLTLIELALGFAMMYMESTFLISTTKGVILILMMAKAFYIVGYFMHLKHELRNMVMTVIVPLFLFVWFIISFLADGNSYKNLRNNYDRNHFEKSQQKVERHEEPGTHTLE